MKKLVLTALALAASGCATYGPTWSEVSGQQYYNRTTMYLRPAIIEKIDGNSAFASYPIKLEPGRHEIVLEGPTAKWPGGTPLHTITLDMEPCKRYYINAQFDNPATTPNWKPVVNYVETIAGCRTNVAAK